MSFSFKIRPKYNIIAYIICITYFGIAVPIRKRIKVLSSIYTCRAVFYFCPKIMGITSLFKPVNGFPLFLPLIMRHILSGSLENDDAFLSFSLKDIISISVFHINQLRWKQLPYKTLIYYHIGIRPRQLILPVKLASETINKRWFGWANSLHIFECSFYSFANTSTLCMFYYSAFLDAKENFQPFH